MIKTLTGNFNFLNMPRNFQAKRQGGEGWHFFSRKCLYCLSCIKISI
jgi:hypothetical protein